MQSIHSSGHFFHHCPLFKPYLVSLSHNWASLVTQIVKSLPEMQETQVKSLSQEHPLAKGMALHSSILAWRIPWTEEPDGL